MEILSKLIDNNQPSYFQKMADYYNKQLDESIEKMINNLSEKEVKDILILYTHTSLILYMSVSQNVDDLFLMNSCDNECYYSIDMLKETLRKEEISEEKLNEFLKSIDDSETNTYEIIDSLYDEIEIRNVKVKIINLYETEYEDDYYYSSVTRLTNYGAKLAIKIYEYIKNNGFIEIFNKAYKDVEVSVSEVKELR